MNFRCTQDNVLIVFEPEATISAGGIHMPGTKKTARHSRKARVVASGPGYYTSLNKFIPNETRRGDLVCVDSLAGQDYSLDLTVPRHNKSADFQELCGVKGEFRVVREQEIHFVIEEEAEAAE